MGAEIGLRTRVVIARDLNSGRNLRTQQNSTLQSPGSSASSKARINHSQGRQATTAAQGPLPSLRKTMHHHAAHALAWLPEVDTETAVSPWLAPEDGAGADALLALGAAAGLPLVARPGAGAEAPSRLLLVLPVGAGAL